jgi:hypothetical protein
LGDLSRFANPRQLMAYLGLVPSEAGLALYDADTHRLIIPPGTSRSFTISFWRVVGCARHSFRY